MSAGTYSVPKEPAFVARAPMNPLGAAATLGAIVFLAALFGIHTRSIGELAAFWPANALLLGLLVRNPHWAGPLSWIAAITAYLAADLLTGSSFMKSILLTSANIVGIGTGFAIYTRLNESSRRLQSPLSVLHMALTAATAAAVAGMVGAVANPILFGGGVLEGWAFWFVAELVNIAILPVVLTAPDFSWPTAERRRAASFTIDPVRLAPLLVFFLAMIGAHVIGGPGAVAIPVPALLWCALTYSRFITAVLALAVSAWALLAISTGLLAVAADIHALQTILSIRLGVMLIALAPITTATVMAARNELLVRLQYIADHDHLTGALDRRAFQERCAALLPRLAAQRRPVAVLILDIDHFKKINDTYGHAAGDQMLVAFAKVVQDKLRANDAFARVGGEEFAVLLPECSRPAAEAIAERIRLAFAETVIDLEAGRLTSATVSIGVAFAPMGLTAIDPLLALAARALYRAKSLGRNRVEGEEAGPEPLIELQKNKTP